MPVDTGPLRAAIVALNDAVRNLAPADAELIKQRLKDLAAAFKAAGGKFPGGKPWNAAPKRGKGGKGAGPAPRGPPDDGGEDDGRVDFDFTDWPW